MTLLLFLIVLLAIAVPVISVESKAVHQDAKPVNGHERRAFQIPAPNVFDQTRFSSSFTGFAGLDHADHWPVAQVSKKQQLIKEGECISIVN